MRNEAEAYHRSRTRKSGNMSVMETQRCGPTCDVGLTSNLLRNSSMATLSPVKCFGSAILKSYESKEERKLKIEAEADTVTGMVGLT